MKRDTTFTDLDLLKMKETMSVFDLIDFIKRDLRYNNKIDFSSMVHYLKGEINAYMHPEDIGETEGEYINKLSGKRSKLITLSIPGLKILVREKLAGGGDIKFIPVMDNPDDAVDEIEDELFDDAEELDS